MLTYQRMCEPINIVGGWDEGGILLYDAVYYFAPRTSRMGEKRWEMMEHCF